MAVGSDAPVSIVVITMFRRTYSIFSTHTIHYIYADIDIYCTTCSTDDTIPERDMDNQHARFASLCFTRLGRQ